MTDAPHIDTLANLGPNFWLAAYCRTCFRYTRLERTRLILRYGPDIDLDDLRARLTCSGCGARDALLYRGWDVGGYRREG